MKLAAYVEQTSEVRLSHAVKTLAAKQTDRRKGWLTESSRHWFIFGSR